MIPEGPLPPRSPNPLPEENRIVIRNIELADDIDELVNDNGAFQRIHPDTPRPTRVVLKAYANLSIDKATPFLTAGSKAEIIASCPPPVAVVVNRAIDPVFKHVTKKAAAASIDYCVDEVYGKCQKARVAAPAPAPVNRQIQYRNVQ